MKTIQISTNKKEELIDITNQVKNAVKIEKGFLYLYSPHTTAGLTINENYDPDVKTDIIKSLNQVVKDLPDFQHMEGNSTAHVKTLLTGKSLQIAIEDGRLVLGRWDGILFCEYDGPRNREIKLKIVKEK